MPKIFLGKIYNTMKFKEWLTESTEPNTKTHESQESVEVSYNDPNVRGYLHAERDPENPQIYRVNRVTVTPEGMGYGKKLYMLALELVSKRGGILAPAKVQTSDKALNVWRSLYKSPNIEKTPLAAKDWGIGARHERMMKAYPNLRFSNPATYPPKQDAEWWAMNSGYKIKTAPNNTAVSPKAAPANPTKPTTPTSNIQRRIFPPGTGDLELEDLGD